MSSPVSMQVVRSAPQSDMYVPASFYDLNSRTDASQFRATVEICWLSQARLDMSLFSIQKLVLSSLLSQVRPARLHFVYFHEELIRHILLFSTAHSAPIRSMTFTSSLLITASDDKRVNVFDLRALTAASTGATGGGGASRRGQVASLGGHEGWVVSVEARNERLLASG